MRDQTSQNLLYYKTTSIFFSALQLRPALFINEIFFILWNWLQHLWMYFIQKHDIKQYDNVNIILSPRKYINIYYIFCILAHMNLDVYGVDFGEICAYLVFIKSWYNLHVKNWDTKSNVPFQSHLVQKVTCQYNIL